MISCKPGSDAARGQLSTIGATAQSTAGKGIANPAVPGGPSSSNFEARQKLQESGRRLERALGNQAHRPG